MECEKRAVRDFHRGVNSEAKEEAFLPLPIDKPKPNMMQFHTCDNSISSSPQKIEIPESKLQDTANNSPMKEMPWILPQPNILIPPPRSSLLMDESTARINVIDESTPRYVGPSTQELRNIKNMILDLQVDLQDERTKRECLEEKVRKFEGNLTQQPHKTPERK